MIKWAVIITLQTLSGSQLHLTIGRQLRPLPKSPRSPSHIPPHAASSSGSQGRLARGPCLRRELGASQRGEVEGRGAHRRTPVTTLVSSVMKMVNRKAAQRSMKKCSTVATASVTLRCTCTAPLPQSPTPAGGHAPQHSSLTATAVQGVAPEP